MLMNRIDELHDAMEAQLDEGLNEEAADIALELVTLLKQAADSPLDTLDGVTGKLTVRELLGSDSRTMRKDMASDK